MRVPLVDLTAQFQPIKQEVMQAIEEVLDSMHLFLGPNTGWRIVGTRDLDGDGKADLLWSTRGDLGAAVWLMDGLAAKSYATLATGGSNAPYWRLFY